jgi:hypothetical protein
MHWRLFSVRTIVLNVAVDVLERVQEVGDDVLEDEVKITVGLIEADLDETDHLFELNNGSLNVHVELGFHLACNVDIAGVRCNLVVLHFDVTEFADEMFKDHADFSMVLVGLSLEFLDDVIDVQGEFPALPDEGLEDKTVIGESLLEVCG